jgi:tetratricopeptide (TPR) repeat protein
MAKVPLRTYNREIESMVDRGLLDEAIGHCQHILKTFPKHLETYRLLGKAYLEYKRYKDAVDIFSRVLVAEPNDFVANVGLSIIRDEENKLDDAIWHMERAFEVQPSNAAIQSELQRLYGRREGVQPPRIRMTRGALAHMYVQGELYPQAISEIKSVLKDDVGRSDMQVLLARAYYRSGQKTQAADEASGVLRRYPYCLDANRILVEILGVDRPENAQVYRQRVIELDPYAAQVAGSIFQSGEVGDAAVTIERLDWNGQPVRRESDWESTSAIRLESEAGRGTQTEPDWLKGGAFTDSTPPPQPKPTFVPTLPASTSASDFSASSDSAGQPAQPTPAEDIPDFLREAGWGQSTGAFDESQPIFGSEPEPSSSAPIEQGELPDWVKAMAPPETMQPVQPAEEEELPDWINKIGTGALPATSAASSSDLDWLAGTDQTAPSSSQPAPADQLDWLKDVGTEVGSAPTTSAEEQPDWMNQLNAPSSSQLTESQPAAEDELDWLKGVGAETTSTTSAEEQPDWMKQLDTPLSSELAETQPAAEDELDWLKGVGAETTSTTSAEEQPDWMKQWDTPLSSELAETQPAAEDELDWLKGVGNEIESAPTTSAEEQPDWMKQLDTPSSSQLTESQPVAEDELDWLKGVEDETEPAPTTSAVEQPDWLTQFGSQPVESEPVAPAAAQNEFDFLDELAEQPAQSVSPVSSLADTENLGVSDQERDDSFAWLENLAAKQGATEGLLTRPEDRLEQEPDWVTQAKNAPQAPVQPVGNVEELGKSEQERDDSFAWLENLAAKQGATEGLLTKPEDRLEKEPDWVAQAKSAPQTPVQPPANVEELGKSEQERDDSFAWLENLAAKQGATEGLLTKPEDRLEKEPDWVAQAKTQPQAPVQPPANVEELGKSEQERDDSFAWLENLAAKQGATEGLLTKPEDRLEQEPDWVAQAKTQPQAPVQPPANVEDLGKSEQEPDWITQARSAPEPAIEEPADEQPAAMDETTAWLRTLDEEESKPEVVSSKDETAMWFRKLEEAQPAPAPETADVDDMPAWLQGLEEEETPITESVLPASDIVTETPTPTASTEAEFDWLNNIEEPVTPLVSTPASDEDNLPSWLKGMDEETRISESLPQDDLPAWMRDETGEVLVEPERIQPTRAADWQPVTESVPEPEPEPPTPQPVVAEEPRSQPPPEPIEVPQSQPKSTPVRKAPLRQAEVKPATPPEPYREPVTRRGTGMLTMPIDPMLGSARSELSRSNIPGALEAYGKLIKKGRFLDEVIFDLREALYRYPVEVSIWQSLGDAYMRANRLQDALDAYTKAEELLR